MPDPLDVLGLRRPASGLRFGSVDAGFAAGGGSVTSALNTRTTAAVNLRHRLLAGLPVDYLAPIAFGSATRTLFNGTVIEAIPDGPVVRLTADAAPELVERQILHLESRVPHFELVHLMARSAGIPEERLDIEGMDALPLE